MDKNSKSYKICKHLFEKGWRVNEQTGEVIKPDGTIKNVQKQKNKKMTYFCFNVKYKGESYPLKIHQFFAYYKYGNKVLEHDCIRHLDEDSLNNSLDNIVLGSHSDNAFDRKVLSRKEHAKKANSEKAIKKRKQTFKEIGHSQGEKNPNYGKVWCVEEDAVDCSNRKQIKKDKIPEGWISTTEWRKKQKVNNGVRGRHWYNNGEKSYLLFPNEAEGLVKGRLTNSSKEDSIVV